MEKGHYHRRDTLREAPWYPVLFKILYTKSTFSVLKCEEGIDCPYKQRIKYTETSMEFPEQHLQKLIWWKAQILIIEENPQGYRGHKSRQELEELFKKRTQGWSYFGKMLVRKLELHLQKHANRVETLKDFFQDDFKWHFPNNKALATFCNNYRKEQFFNFKDFNNSIGSFLDLKTNYDLNNPKTESDIIILDIKEDPENFVIQL